MAIWVESSVRWSWKAVARADVRATAENLCRDREFASARLMDRESRSRVGRYVTATQRRLAATIEGATNDPACGGRTRTLASRSVGPTS